MVTAKSAAPSPNNVNRLADLMSRQSRLFSESQKAHGVLSLKLPCSVIDALNQAAAKSGRSVEELAVCALEKILKTKIRTKFSRNTVPHG